jgi:hypothetical protein
MKKLQILALKAVDILGAPITILSTLWLRNVKRALHFLPVSKKIFSSLGLLPIRHHYYEPVVFEGDLRKPLSDERNLPGVDLNIPAQLEFLKTIPVGLDLTSLPLNDPGDGSYFYRNTLFEAGDAEYLFGIFRQHKPSRVVEIGAGFSTLIIQYAIQKNKEDDPSYSCDHTCIEPFEAPWLEQTGAIIIREKAELVDPEVFNSLGKNDVLFIDSSHVIRPQGDVLFEFLELLATLNSGVLVHIHDIYTPRDYPEKWVLTYAKLWNEQYLLEAFLSHNNAWRVLGSLNYLWHNHREALIDVCPMLKHDPEIEPTSFWLVRN